MLFHQSITLNIQVHTATCNLIKRKKTTTRQMTYSFLFSYLLYMQCFAIEALEGGGVPVSHIPLSMNIANISKIQKALYPHIPKIDPSIPYPFEFLAKISVSLKTLPGPHYCTKMKCLSRLRSTCFGVVQFLIQLYGLNMWIKFTIIPLKAH